ncbi:MAG TPA: sensor histidine kinase [Caulobacteraceae bacterium]|jgi:signal transduction histidine kinase
MNCIAAKQDVRLASAVHGATRHPMARAKVSALAAARRPPSAADEAAIMAERRRIAREIHDTLAQGFAAIRLQLELALSESELSPQVSRALELAYQIAGENLVESRRSMAALKSAQPSLETMLSAAVEGVRRLGEVKIVAELAAAPALPEQVVHELLRIAQEAMRNATRHAQATTVRVVLTPLPGGVRLTVIDDGKGFDPDATSSGFGLSGLRERAAGIGAKLTIDSAPGRGAKIVATWFYLAEVAAAA